MGKNVRTYLTAKAFPFPPTERQMQYREGVGTGGATVPSAPFHSPTNFIEFTHKTRKSTSRTARVGRNGEMPWQGGGCMDGKHIRKIVYVHRINCLTLLSFFLFGKKGFDGRCDGRYRISMLTVDGENRHFRIHDSTIFTKSECQSHAVAFVISDTRRHTARSTAILNILRRCKKVLYTFSPIEIYSPFFGFPFSSSHTCVYVLCVFVCIDSDEPCESICIACQCWVRYFLLRCSTTCDMSHLMRTFCAHRNRTSRLEYALLSRDCNTRGITSRTGCGGGGEGVIEGGKRWRDERHQTKKHFIVANNFVYFIFRFTSSKSFNTICTDFFFSFFRRSLRMSSIFIRCRHTNWR